MSITKIVCWHCRKSGITLRKIDKNDYACNNCLKYGMPPNPNSSTETLITKRKATPEELESLGIKGVKTE